MEIVMSMTDFHVPFQDKRAINVALKLAQHIKPKILIIHEILDWYQLSSFNKDPRRINDLQKDLNKSHKVLNQIRNILPKSRIVMVESNHDTRLRRYKFSKAPELASLKNLSFEKLMELKKYNVEYRQDFTFRGVLFKHGSIVRKESSYTAKAEYLKEGTSGASGHTHRLGMYFKTLRGGKYVWIESGCLCKTKNIEYIDGTADWQQGVSMFMFKDGKRSFQPKVVPIVDYEILWGKHLFKA